MSLDYYDVLGLKRDCAPDEIARAYRTLSLKWHPKLSKEKEQTAFYHFSQISESYEVLSCPIKRAFFDKYGEKALKEGFFVDGEIQGGYQFGGNPDQIFVRFFEKENAFAKIYDNDGREMFGSMFGFAFGAQNFPGLPPTKELIVDVYCDLNELYTGCMKEMRFKRTVLNNDGRTTREETLKRILDIKPGYQEGNTIVFKEQGHENTGKKTSDLIFKIIERQHPEFERKGNDLIYTAKISLIQALCPESIKIVTLDGRTLMVSLDEIVHPKSLKKIAGEGMPIYDEGNSGKKGNLLIKFDIEFPESLEQGDKQEIIEILKRSIS